MTQPRRIDPVGLVAGGLLPLLGASFILLLTAVWEPRLPAQIAQHWDAGGQADAFGAPWPNAILLASVSAAVGLGCGAPAMLARTLLALRQVLVVAALMTTGLFVAIWVSVLHAQLDLEDAAAAQLALWPVGLGAAVGLLVGVAAAKLLRDGRVRTNVTHRPPSYLPRHPVVDVREDLGVSLKLRALILAPLVLIGLVIAITSKQLWPVLVFVPIGLFVVALLHYRIEVDGTGLRAYGLGLRAFDITVDEIVKAEVKQVSPVGDFGGWGLRATGKGRYGLVTRKGPAVVITVGAGQTFTMTTDRAKEIAGVLNTAADSRRP